MKMKEEILKAENIDKSFGVTHAVNNITLSFAKGEIHGLIGENGSGKSTFTSMLTGICSIDSGKFILEDKELKVKNQVEANHNGVSIIVQETGTLPGLTVTENIFLGNEDRFIKFGIKNTVAMDREAQALLNKYGFNRIKATMLIDNYNFETRKLVEIVKATYFDPKVVVFDETTTSLGHEGRTDLYKQMNRIKDEGHTVIFISHDLAEVIEHTDVISVLRDGKLIETVKSSDVSEDDLKRLMVGRILDGRYYRTDYGEAVSDEVVLSVKNVTVPKQLKNINFELHKGEILGIGGLSECGMHEVGKAVFGASYDRTGDVTLADGTHINSITAAIKHSIAYASKDRDNESLVVNDTICDNICLPSMDDLKVKHILLSKTLSQFANKYAKIISIKMVDVNQFVSDLSGGNKQKVVLARWIGKNSDVIVLDSPTRGIDVKVKADIYALMSEMKKQGKSIILISEEILELLGMSDRVLVMRNGAISGEFMRDTALTEEHLITKMI